MLPQATRESPRHGFANRRARSPTPIRFSEDHFLCSADNVENSMISEADETTGNIMARMDSTLASEFMQTLCRGGMGRVGKSQVMNRNSLIQELSFEAH